MPQLTFDVPAGSQATRILNAVCERNGYNAAIHGTKLEFLKAWTIRMWKDEAKGFEGSAAGAAAQQAAAAAVESEITIT